MEKTKEELNTIKDKNNNENNESVQLTDENLEQVAGGGGPFTEMDKIA